ncbi:MAG: zf-HC2 domain-containing protein [Bryobacteraceae bacterium]
MTATECRDVFARLSEYLDKDLPPDLCERIEAHIEGCAPCVEFVESLRKSTELCRQFLEQEKPGPLPEEMREQFLEAYRGLGMDAKGIDAK